MLKSNQRLVTCILVCGTMVAAGSPASAQSGLTCADFQHNSDGSWSPVHPVTINGVTMGPGVAFREGVSFGGVDLAAALNKQCF